MNLSVLQDTSEQIRYNDPKLPLYVSRGDLKTFSNMAALCHWHDDVELLLPRKGYLNYNVNGSCFTVPQGSAVFVNSRQMHYGYSADGTDCEYICVTFRPQQLLGSGELVSRYVLPILTAAHFPCLILEPSEHRSLLEQILLIDRLYQTRQEGFEILAVSAVFVLWHGLYTLMKQRIEAASAADPNLWIVKQMLEFIRTHYADKVTLNRIANAGGVCRTRCCQIFRQYLGMTPNDYLNSFRLEKSMELLRQTDLPVTEIASATGFGSASYFTELFSRQKGCSPTQYRKK